MRRNNLVYTYPTMDGIIDFLKKHDYLGVLQPRSATNLENSERREFVLSGNSVASQPGDDIVLTIVKDSEDSFQANISTAPSMLFNNEDVARFMDRMSNMVRFMNLVNNNYYK
jgi:hypothetical protein